MGAVGAEPLVSTVLTCFNSAQYLQQTLASVRAQTHQNWELIAVDDCSTDNTRSILHAAVAEDARIRVVEHASNAGRPSRSKNTGLRHARGDYVQFIDHDDLYLPTRTAVLLDMLQRRPDRCVAFCDMHYVDSANALGERYLPAFLHDARPHLRAEGAHEFVLEDRFFVFQALHYAAMHTLTVLIARHRLRDLSLAFDESLTITDDTDLWIRLGLQGGVVYTDLSLARYRLHGSNLTRRTALVAADIARLVNRNRKRLAGLLNPGEQAQLRTRECNAYADLGWAHRSAGNRKAALAAYLRALRLGPSPRLAWATAKAWLPVRN